MSSLTQAILLACCLLADCLSKIQAIIYPECSSVERYHTYVSSQQSCAKYIYCDGEKSYESECLDDFYFDEVQGNCADRSVVFCRIESNGYFNNDNGAMSSYAGSQDNANAGNIDANTVGNNHNSDSIIDLKDIEHVKDYEEDFDDNHANEPAIVHRPSLNTGKPNSFPTILPNAVTSEPIMASPVPTLPVDFLETTNCRSTLGKSSLLHLPNPDSCASYFTCYNGIAIAMICGRDQYFNAQSGKCEQKERVQCVQRRPVTLQCVKGVNDFMPHPYNCEYYYICANGFLMIHQCPANFNWDYERKTCIQKMWAKCFSNTFQQEILLAKSNA